MVVQLCYFRRGTKTGAAAFNGWLLLLVVAVAVEVPLPLVGVAIALLAAYSGGCDDDDDGVPYGVCCSGVDVAA
jgi:hypothetical protein